MWKTKSNEIDEASVHKIVQATSTFDTTIFKHVFTNDVKVQFIRTYNILYPTSVGIVTVSSSDEFDGISDDLLSQIPIPTTATRESTMQTYYGTQSQNTTNTATTTTSTLQTATTPSTVATPTTVDTPNNNEDIDQEANYNYDKDYDNTNNNDMNNDANNNGTNDKAMIIDNPNVLIRTDIAQLSTLLKKSFVEPWDKHLLDAETRQINANLVKYATSRIKSKATDKAAAIVANEPSATPQIMSDLIIKAVSKETALLQKKLTKLEQQLSRSSISKPVVNNNNKNNISKAKNDKSGEKKTRASSRNKSKNKQNNNKSSSKKSTTSNAKPKSKRKAGDANNDTKKDNKKPSNNNKKMSSKGKKNNIPRVNTSSNRTRIKV